ncbi:amino acid adenylation domain-containing protein [Nonomuraea sp. NPDC049714]|uniref:amino acid adenylation domain-containing protein n=1 Tax=Nonomuraea sp. NPDC049714 TaxID=3364357 RepID=UPI00379BE716
MTHHQESLPATFTQQVMWISERMGAGPAYHMPLALWLDGYLDVGALLSACADVAARHPVLATAVEESGDGPRLVTGAEPSVTLTDDVGPATGALIRQESARGFDLEKGPLARFTLAPAGPNRHLLLFVAHHLVFDGMSKDILINDLARCYASRMGSGTPGPVPPLPIDDVVRAEHQRVSAALPAARDFWAARWTRPTDLVLPGQRRTTGRHGVAGQIGVGEQIDVGVDRELGRDAAAVAAAVGATTFEVLLAGVHALLFRYGTENVAVAIDVTTRGPATREHIGPFVNELAVLSRPAADQAFGRFVQDIRSELRELYRFREVPLARAAGLPPGGAAIPVSISYRKAAADPVFPGLELSVDRMMFGGGVRNALHLQFVDGPDGLALCLRFDPAAVDTGTVTRFADGLRALLRDAAAEPDTHLSDLDVLPAAERRRLLTEWNDTAAAYPAGATLPGLFAEQVRARPDATAVTCQDRSLSFAGLDAAADRLALRLRAAGVARGDLVAVHLRRSDNLLISLLAVHRCGAAYLPLDPDHPAERLAMITADAKPRLLLSETPTPDLSVPALVVGEGDPDSGLKLVGGTGPEPDEIAYVIYTSGSTGRPKGVEVDHRNLANLLLAMRDRLKSGPADTWLALTSPAFDISALELYLPLVTGGRIVVAPHGAVRRPEALARLVAEQGVTHVQATPSVWRLLLPGGIGGVTALTGGEALPPGLAEELRARCDRVLNVYGPTETTIWSTYGELGDTVTIGRPLANTQIYLLDEALRPVPMGVAGELCVGGAGVARGYRGRPGRTAERFVPDPYGPPGSRLYRTGDLARYRADGEIEFLGRQDGQVKLLGHRIELGEIETRLLEHPEVAEAAVIVRDTDADDPRLIAYVVPAPNVPSRPDAPIRPAPGPGGASEPSPASGPGAAFGPGPVPGPGAAVEARAVLEPGALNAHLARTLPPAMLPSSYVLLDALPLTPVGKLDRAALPVSSGALTDSSDAPAVAPSPVGGNLTGSVRGDLVDTVGRIWREVLDPADVDEIGVDDDLFDLGGHSLTMTQITARIRERLGVDVSLDAFFDDPTITGIVEEITRLRADQPTADDPDEGDDRPVRRPPGVSPPLSFGQERLWFLQRFDPRDASYNMCLVLRLRGALDVGALDAALEALVARHESLRTRFPDVNGEPIAVIHPPGPVQVERLDLTPDAASDAAPERDSTADCKADPEERARRLVAERTNAPFDLAGAPPLRITLLTIGPGHHVLCFVLHHIIADGSSFSVLFDDLFAFYQAAAAGAEPPLAPLPVQFGDIALWQRERDRGEAAEESLDYWRRRLAEPPLLELPTDKPGGERPEGAFHTFRIPQEVVARLERLAQEHGASLFMVLVAAYQVLLARHTGQSDILVGTPWATRDRVELEPVIGYLTDTLVLRGDLTGDPPFRDLLAATRGTVLDAHAHRAVPFERLIGELGVPRDLQRNPLLATMIILHSQAGDGAPPERVGGLGVELFDGGFRQAKFDLALETWRNDEGLLAVLGYDATLFHAATVEGLAERFAVLLRGIADAPETPLSRLPLLTGRDTAALAGGGDPAALTGGGAPYRQSEPVPVLFQRAVAATPDATALLCGAERVSYAELDLRVARLAAALRRRGVADGCVVGAFLDRSAEAVVALLAIWRAGGAYLPLDPDHPDERLAFLIGDSAARLVVTDERLARRLPPDTVTLIAADEARRGDDRWLGGWHEVEPDDPAYVIYTSGSTGVPKGVLVEHGSLAGRVRWMREAYDLRPGDRVVQFASLSFDAHVEELYPALTAGAGVLLLPDGALSLPAALRTPAGREVTVLDLPTAYWHRLTESPDDVAWPEGLRLVILGGEQVQATAVARWRDRFGDRIRLVNTYGPTEATVIATAVTLGVDDATRRPPIGWPLDGTTAHVLGPYGEPVPPGFPGELCLGGAGLARGYLGRPALTAERFIPDPYGPPGSRLYRTGDRARRLPDGTLEFLGRLDGQVKVRGFRVEPGEVEAALLAHPGVRQAVVTAAADRLVAYVVGAAQPDELRRHLAARLPAHLVPTSWVPLDALPLTITGKIDPAALPAPEPEAAALFVPPGTDAEALVAGVWEQVLGLDVGRVGTLDDFFALGGHSLLATRVAALLGNALEVEVPIRTVFDRPSVAELAAAVENLLIEQLSGLSDAEAARLLDVEVPR